MIDRRYLTRFIVALALLAGTAHAQAEAVHVFAAASLKDALDDASAAWSAETGKDTKNTYAASSALAKQIEGGAPADIFISADLDWMKHLSDKGLTVKDTEVQLLGNTLVLIAPADSKASLKIAPGFDLAKLVGDGKLAVCDVQAVPAGKYGKAALEKLGVWESVKSKIAQAENVRAALKFVATGEAAAGIVYQTDVNVEPMVKVLDTFPEDTHPKIIYPAAVLADSKSADAASFLTFLKSPKAAAIFAKAGFKTLVAN